MADFKRLTINLSLFATDQGSKSPNSTSKSPRNFENGIVGLGIVAAMNNLSNTHQHPSAKSSRASAILAVTSPRSNLNSNPIPIDSKSLVNPKASKFRGEPNSKKNLMEMSESYTCVISHIGNDLVKKREYFDDDDDDDDQHQSLAAATTSMTAMTTTYLVNEGVFTASPPRNGEADMNLMPFQSADFLNSCFLCKKKLHGLDIFMYRGEKAFCSAECRSKQIANDDYKEKFGSGAMKPLDYSVSPCSGPMMFFAGMAAA